VAKRVLKNKYKDECKEAYSNFERERTIGGLKITHIPKPPHHTKIDNYGLPKDERVFKYFDFPEIDYEIDENGNLTNARFSGLTQQEEVELVDKVYGYIMDGYWWYNGDNLEYITGDNWYFLNLVKIDVVKTVDGELIDGLDNPMFVDGHRDIFLFWKECELKRRCFGMLLVTRRRWAKTTIALTLLLKAAATNMRKKIGMQAQTGDVAIDNYQKLLDIWDNLPKHPAFYPLHAGSTRPAKKLEFRAPTKKSSKASILKKRKALDSWVGYKTTKVNAYDGAGLYRYYLDEASKIDECDVNDLFDVVRESMAHGTLARGKMIVTSTADNVGGKTLPNFERLWKNSDLEIAKESDLGMTSTGLYRLFVPADIGYTHDAAEDGTLLDELNKPTIDKWGYSDRETAKKVILATRQTKSGNDLIKYIRKYPLTIEEAFAVEKGVSPFNTTNINDQLQFNIQAEVKPTRGNFEWIGNNRDKVVWYPNENGKWELSWMPPKEHQCALKKGFDGLLPIHNECYTGVDPYEADSTVEKGSDAAATTWVNAGQFFKRPTKVCRYVHRPPTAEQMFEDLLKQCVFFSSRALIENNAGRGIIRQWKNWGFKGLIMADPLNPEKYKEGTSTKPPDTRNAMINGLRTYIETCIGIVDPENMEYAVCAFNDGLKEWRDFEADNWTPYDEVVADMLSLHAIPKVLYRPKKYTLDDLVHTKGSNNSRGIRKLI